MEKKIVDLYCGHSRTAIQHLANHLENEGIEFQITGDTATGVLGIYNPTQEICIRVFENDAAKAKQIIEPYVQDS